MRWRDGQGHRFVVQAEVRLQDCTLWLTKQQLADLYESTPQDITQHIRAIYTESELSETATCK